MTATASPAHARRRLSLPSLRGRRAHERAATRAEIPPLSPRLAFVRAVLIIVCALAVSLLLKLFVISGVEQRAAQQQAYDTFREELATGTAPIGPTDSTGAPLALGAPVAYLEIPAIGLRQVIGEGTASAQLFSGPGHRRDSPLPGQTGTSIVMGRRAAFGGPFARIDQLKHGDKVTVTTGQGKFTFTVLGVRHQGDPSPPALTSGQGRLLLATAAGQPFFPSGVLRVDADLDGKAVGGPARLISPSALPSLEQFGKGDTSLMWVLALWLQVMIALAVGAVWAWHRWGRAQAWIVFVPPLLLVSLYVSNEAARALPNLL